MWLNGSVVFIGPGRALMRGQNVAMPTILESFAWKCELGLHSRSFSWLFDRSGYLDSQRRCVYCRWGEVARSLSPSKGSWLEGLAAPAAWKSHTMAGALHDGEIPPLLLPTWRRFLQAAVERKFPSRCRLKLESCGIAVALRGSSGVGPADGVDCR
jgi:hypothetical protein